MDVSLLSSEFVNLLKKFRSSVNKEIENLEHSTQDMDVLMKTVDEISSLLKSEGLPIFIGELKNILKIVTVDENNSVINENNIVTVSETKKLSPETLKTNKVEKVNDQMDVEISEIKGEETVDIKKSDLLKYKQEWPLRFAKLLCEVVEPILPFLTLKRNSDLLFYLDDLILCNDTNMLADIFHVIRCDDPETKETTFKCYEDFRGTEEADVHIHTDIARRIYERMMNFVTLYSEPLQKPHIPKATWKRFLIRVNSSGESLVEIRASWPDTEISVLINKLKEEFSSEEAKDCNLCSFLISFNDQPDSHVVFGMPNIMEKIWNMSFVTDHSRVTQWNPVAMRNLSEALCKLAKPNKNQTGIMFFESIYSAVPLLYMADTCKNVVLLRREDDMQKFYISEALRNNILNFSCDPNHFNLNQVMSKYFSECSEVCLVIYAVRRFMEKDANKIIRCEKISKIIFFFAFENIFFLRKLPRFLKFENIEYPFIITKLVPVDLCPFKDSIQMLCLLERTSLTLGKVTNKNFSAEIFNNIKNMDSKLAFSYFMRMKEKLEAEEMLEKKRMSEIILKHLSELQFIDGISNPKPLKKTLDPLEDTYEYSHTSPLKKMRCQVTDDDISNTLPLKEPQQHVTDEISNTLPVKNSNMTSVAFLDDLNESQKMIMTQIIKDLEDANKLDTDDEYNTAVTYKREKANLEAERLSDILIRVLPHIIGKTIRGFAFKQMDITLCPPVQKLCEKHHIILERNSTGKILNTLNSDNEMIPLRHSFSCKAKNICKLMAAFILKSNYPMFNKEGQGFWSMIIRVNSKGDSWLLIEGNVDTLEEARIILSDLEPKLKSFIETGLVARKAPDLKNVILKIFTKTNAEAQVVLGDYMLNERFGLLNIKFHGERFPYYIPDGMMVYANDLLKLASLGKKWGVVQVGCGCGIESLLLAKRCAKFYLLRLPGLQNIYFLPEENGVRNFVDIPVNNAQEMVSVIVKDLAEYPSVCVIYNLSDPVGFFGASVLQNNFHVKRIIYVIDPKNNEWIKEAVACCQKKTDCKEAFAVKKFASVDMAPCEDSVKMMLVLERESMVKPKLNRSFSVNALKELLAG